MFYSLIQQETFLNEVSWCQTGECLSCMKMALEFRTGSTGFPLAKECGDYHILQTVDFLSDYMHSVLTNIAYPQDM